MASTKAAPRRPNRRGEGSRLRGEIVRAATRLLRERGDDAHVTLRAVAREAGIAAPSIYAHFPDPDAVVAAVVAERFAALLTALRAARHGITDPAHRLSAQCYGYLRFAEAEPGLYRVLFDRARRIADPASAPVSDADARRQTASNEAVIYEAGYPAFQFLVDTIASCVESGQSTSQDPFVDAVNLWSALHGYCMLRVAAPEFPWPDERTTVDAMVTAQARLRP